MVPNRSVALRSTSGTRLAISSSFNNRASVQLGRRILLRNKQRGYASATEQKTSTLRGDLPWLISAVVVTVPSTIYCLQPRNPVKDHHDDHGGNHSKEESSAEEEKEDDTPPESSDSDSEESTDDKPVESSHSQDSPKSDESSIENDNDTSGDEEKPQNQTLSAETTSKDQMKRRENSETAGGLPMGMRESKNDGETGSAQDKAAASKESLSFNQMSGKQAGLSNTPTKHSRDPTHDPNMSKKAEGAPETAKLQGTVKSNRPSSDNKEKFGQDKL